MLSLFKKGGGEGEEQNAKEQNHNTSEKNDPPRRKDSFQIWQQWYKKYTLCRWGGNLGMEGGKR